MIGVIERLYRCVMLAFGRGRITFVDDSGAVQKLQVRFGSMEIIDNMPAPHDYGYTCHPPIGSDVFASFWVATGRMAWSCLSAARHTA